MHMYIYIYTPFIQLSAMKQGMYVRACVRACECERGGGG